MAEGRRRPHDEGAQTMTISMITNVNINVLSGRTYLCEYGIRTLLGDLEASKRCHCRRRRNFI